MSEIDVGLHMMNEGNDDIGHPVSPRDPYEMVFGTLNFGNTRFDQLKTTDQRELAPTADRLEVPDQRERSHRGMRVSQFASDPWHPGKGPLVF